jgi:hypothetical protein
MVDAITAGVSRVEIDAFTPLGYVPTEKQQIFHDLSRQKIGAILYGGAAGGGKGLLAPDREDPAYDPSTEGTVLTPFGFKLIGDIRVGDKVCNPDGTVATVIKVTANGPMQFYRVTMADGSTVECDEDHLWSIHIAGNRQRRARSGPPVIPDNLRPNDEWNLRHASRSTVVGTLELRRLVLRADEEIANGKRPHYVKVPLTNPTSMTRTYPHPVLPPYTLGAIIGDGCCSGRNSVSIGGIDHEIFDRIESELPTHLKLSLHQSDENNHPDWQTHGIVMVQGVGLESAAKLLDRDGLMGHRAWEKFIPERLKFAPADQRFALMQGMFDTDGYMDSRGHASYTTVSEQLAQDTQGVLRSLGYRATITTKTPRYTYDDVVNTGRLAYTITVQGRHLEKLFHISRKTSRALPFNGGDVEPAHTVVSVEQTVIGPSICITVNNCNQLFITDDYIVTHNSAALLMEAIHCAANYPGMRVACIRRTYNELAESFLAELTKRQYARPLGAKYNQTDRILKFPNDSIVNFTYAQDEEDASRLLGGEYQLFCIDEISLMPEVVIQHIEERLRSGSRSLPVIGMRCASNPGGRAHKYLRDRFIVPTNWGKNGVVLDEDDRTVAYIQSRYVDNPYLDKGYEKILNAIADPQRRAAMRDGDWDAMLGAFFSQYSRVRHVVPSFVPPPEWPRYLGIDYGFREPFAAEWAAIDNDGRVWVYREIYATETDAQHQAQLILEAEAFAGETSVMRVADPSMWGARGTPMSIADLYGMEGCGIAKADNDRLNGWARFHFYLNEAPACDYHRELGWEECPLIHFMDEGCPIIIDSIPNLPRSKTKPDDSETRNVDDHGIDALRYLLMMAGSGGRPVIYNDMPSDRDIQNLEAEKQSAYGVPDYGGLVAGRFAGNLAPTYR